MEEQQILYSMFYKAQDRFLEPYASPGFEPDVIQEYIHCGITLASYYEHHAENENLLLCELYLRQVFFHLIDAIESPKRSFLFRRLCLDSIHSPLFNLKRHYYQQLNGRERFLNVQQTLQQVQAPLG
ncbi:hypothetical protein [Vibrio sp. 99-70-13A1]|uniref:hypothetical protein n=1 Tax=Vibrio sp. 99-70-13A1 TaxID=2607601 RepID=UPI001493543A|nr:hypothetical protein [Vibrio sp. 99-70-13A1]NOH96612.1 hypothetical protein [Vibrio sp. 99-70-13A1]